MKVEQDSEEAGGSQQTFAPPYIDGFTRVEFSSKGVPPTLAPACGGGRVAAMKYALIALLAVQIP